MKKENSQLIFVSLVNNLDNMLDTHIEKDPYGWVFSNRYFYLKFSDKKLNITILGNEFFNDRLLIFIK